MDEKEWGHLISILGIQDVSPQIQQVRGPSQYSVLPSDAAAAAELGEMTRTEKAIKRDRSIYYKLCLLRFYVYSPLCPH